MFLIAGTGSRLGRNGHDRNVAHVVSGPWISYLMESFGPWTRKPFAHVFLRRPRTPFEHTGWRSTGAVGRLKQAFRLSTGIVDEPFISHFALRLFQRLGFLTSPIPKSALGARNGEDERDSPEDTQEACSVRLAFDRLDAFMASGSLTKSIAALEVQLWDADAETAAAVLAASGLDEDLVDSALIVRKRVGMLDTLIHAAVIMRVLPLVLEPGEKVIKRPSLGAGNDPDRNYDLETTHRVAEFKLSSRTGADGGRQRGLFADVVGLSLDTTHRRRQIFVLGNAPSLPSAAPQCSKNPVLGGAQAPNPGRPYRRHDRFTVHARRAHRDRGSAEPSPEASLARPHPK